MKALLKILICLLPGVSFSQMEFEKLDSLEKALTTEKRDTARINCMNGISWILLHQGHYKKAADYALQALQTTSLSLQKSDEDLQTKRRLRGEQAVAVSNLGLMHDMQGNYPEALKYFGQALKIYGDMKHTDGIAVLLNYTGNAYLGLDDYEKAIGHFELGLKFTRSNNLEVIKGFLDNTAVAYSKMGNYEMAKKYFLRAISLDDVEKDSASLALEYCNFAGNYSSMKQFEKADDYYRRALDICRKIRNDNYEVFVLGSMAMNLEAQEKYEDAIKAFDISIDKAEKMKLDNELMEGYKHRGMLYKKLNKPDEAEDDLLKSLSLSETMGYWTGIMDNEEALSELYTEKKKWDLATSHLKSFVSIKDSVFNKEFAKSSARSMLNLEFSKKQHEQRLLREQKEALDEARSFRQKITISFFGIFVICLAGFGFYAYRSYLQKKKINEEISREKQNVETKQKEVLDSIHYARRIQMALMPSEKILRQKMNSH